MRLLLDTQATDEVDVCNVAIVEVDAALAKHVLACRELYQMAKIRAVGLLELVFHDPYVRYYPHQDLDVDVPWVATFNEASIVELPEDFKPQTTVSEYAEDDSPEEDATEVDQMHVGPDGVHWSCYPEHRNVHVTTVEVPYSLFLDVLTKETPKA